MAFEFTLPTTSVLIFGHYLSCGSHPSLVLAATAQRTVLRNELKAHKRLPVQSKSTNLTILLDAVNDYLPYLLALDAGLSGQQVNGEEIHVTLQKEIEVEWRSCIASSPPGRQAPCIKGRGLDYEILFVLVTAAYVHCLSARRQLAMGHSPSSSVSADQRKAGINVAMNLLLTANSLFSHAVKVSESLPPSALPAAAMDVQIPTLSALGSLCLASATLLAVVKDDDFLSLAAQARDGFDREWMYKAPNIPKVRAHLFARLCFGAADHAGKAHALLSTKVSPGVPDPREDLLEYIKDIRQTSRARGCRFLGVDCEVSGKLGEALGWLNAAKRQLGLPVIGTSPNSKGIFKPSFSQIKKDWTERKERKIVEGKGAPSLDDGGKAEEGRVLFMLEKNWSKTNDLISHQIVQDELVLLQTVPTGREFHSPRVWAQPSLDSSALERLRAPPDRDEDENEDRQQQQEEDEEEESGDGVQMPGNFPNGSEIRSASTPYY